MSGISLHEGHPVDALPEYVRGGSADRERIERHLDECEACRLELDILTALGSSGPAPLSDVERERVYRGFEERRVASTSTPGAGGVGSRTWLTTAWRAAAGIALLLTSVGVWQVVQAGGAAPDWDPDVALDGWAEDIADLDLGAGDVRLALGVGVLDDPVLGLPWEAVQGADVPIDDFVPPWEEER